MMAEGTERDAIHEEDSLRSHRSHIALLYDLAQLRDDDCGFFSDTSFNLTLDEFLDFHEAESAGEFPCKIGRYEYDGTTLYFKNMTTIHNDFAVAVDREIDHQLLPLHDHPEIG